MDLSNRSFQTERLLIRSCKPDDAAALTALMTPEISQWVAVWPTPLSIEDTRKILSTNIALAEAGAAFAAVVEEKNSGSVIGWLKLDSSDLPPRTAELGYWIGEDYQRRGYAFEMSLGAIDFGFWELDLTAIRGGARVENHASLKLLEKLGMTRVGVKTVWAPARRRMENCAFWKLKRPAP